MTEYVMGFCPICRTTACSHVTTPVFCFCCKCWHSFVLQCKSWHYLGHWHYSEGTVAKQIVSNAGAPHFLKDLATVSAGQAKTIVVLNPDKAVVSPSSPLAVFPRLMLRLAPHLPLLHLLLRAWTVLSQV